MSYVVDAHYALAGEESVEQRLHIVVAVSENGESEIVVIAVFSAATRFYLFERRVDDASESLHLRHHDTVVHDTFRHARRTIEHKHEQGGILTCYERVVPFHIYLY